MILTTNQKSFVTSILSRKTLDVESFLREFCDLQQTRNTAATYGWAWFHCDVNTNVYIPKDDQSALSSLNEFISLWYLLEKENLIQSSPRASQGKKLFPIFTMKRGVPEPNEQILTIIKNYQENQIIPLAGLEEFFKRGFLTSSELTQIGDSKERVHNRRLGYAAIIVPLLIAIITWFLQCPSGYQGKPQQTIIKTTPRDTIRNNQDSLDQTNTKSDSAK